MELEAEKASAKLARALWEEVLPSKGAEESGRME
jgi:hypothetical protein